MNYVITSYSIHYTKLYDDILNAIAWDTVMTVKQKTDFKAILKTLVYWWVSNIPQDEVQNTVNNEPQSGSWWSFTWLLINVFKWLFYIITWFAFILLIYYIYYLAVSYNFV